MTMAICFKCGSTKSGALVACGSCNGAPHTNSEHAASLVLSDHLSTKDQLVQYSCEIRNKQKLSIPREAISQAFEALKDPQLMAMLGSHSPPPEPSSKLSSSKIKVGLIEEFHAVQQKNNSEKWHFTCDDCGQRLRIPARSELDVDFHLEVTH